MIKTTIHELEEYVLLRTPLLISPSAKVLLKISSIHSYYRTFGVILRSSLKEFQVKRPLFMMDRKINIGGSSPGDYYPMSAGGTYYTFKDNYEAVLNGALPESRLELIPTAIVSFTDGLLSRVRRVTYTAPTAKFKDAGGQVYINYFAQYPLILKEDKKNPGEFTEDSHIYGLAEESGSAFQFFIDILTYNLLRYLRDQKEQISFTELPLQVFSNIETYISELQDRINDWYQNSVWYPELFI